MTRITEFTTIQKLMLMVQQHRQNIDTLSDDISSGIAVHTPGDSSVSGTIAQVRGTLERVEGYKNRIASVEGYLGAQDNVLTTSSDLLIRASEIATQAANESNSPETRSQLAAEVLEIRDHLVSLANTTYQGKYLYAGADDSNPAYSKLAGGYVDVPPTVGQTNDRWVFNTNAGAAVTRTVKVSDDVAVTVNTPGSQVFDNAIQALDKLGRALSGYSTAGAGGTAYTFPADKDVQTQDIRDCITALKNAREGDIMVETVTVAGRLRRLQTGESLMELSKTAGEDVLDRLQSTDLFKAGSEFSMAQTALQSALLVNSKVLNQSILDFL